MRIDLLPGESWYGGIIDDGWRWPLEPGYDRHLVRDSGGNQAQPLLVSSAGRWIWGEQAFRVRLDGASLSIDEAEAALASGHEAGGLRGALAAATRRFMPPSGTMPDRRLFTAPQYNTWIELVYDQAEAPILRYAEAIVAAGYPRGVLMIDDTWQDDYGCWEFNPGRFPDPKGMVRRLHDLGFPVMLWTCPMVSPDSPEFRELRAKGLLVRRADGAVAVREWWNGWGAFLDLTNPGACAWWKERLDRLVHDYGVDGFKFDGGDFRYYQADDLVAVPGPPGHHSEAYARFGAQWPLNEFRACWRMGNQAVAQRLRDKNHDWSPGGVGGCVPNVIAQGLAGYAFACPDMIGGGEYLNFGANRDRLDAELFVRHAQLSALMPMMQFSAAPWRVLDRRHDALCRAAAELHVSHGARIAALAEHAARTGEPIVRHLAWADPAGGHEAVRDQFLLGDDLLVAPVVAKGAVRRTVRFPAGRWIGDDGVAVEGPCIREVDAPLERLPHWRRA